MSKLTFKTRESKGKSAVIQLVFNYGKNKRLRYSTGLRIQNIKNWDEKKMRIKSVIEELDRVSINNKLNDIKSNIERKYSKSIDENKTVNNELITNWCDIFFGKIEIQEKKGTLELIPFYDWYNEHYKTKPLMTTGKPLGKGTLKGYKRGNKILKEFSKTYLVTYDNINQDFYNNFINWLENKNYTTNYIGNQIKMLKTILNSSYELNHHKSLEHTKRYFKKPSETIDNIFLNTDELKRIENLDFSGTKSIMVNEIHFSSERLERARDLFLISANTGLRVSDFNKLERKNIINEGDYMYFSLTSKKNNKKLTIPINSTVKRILNKRKGSLPVKMPEQHINYALKNIGAMANINEDIIMKVTKGGKVIEEIKKKHDLITNHTGRRSFCTNAYLSGMPTIDIMAISGHSTENVFYNYIKVSGLEKAKKIAQHEFFK